MTNMTLTTIYHRVMLYATFILFLLYLGFPHLHGEYYIPLISHENLRPQTIELIAVVALTLVMVGSYFSKSKAEKSENIFLQQHCTWIFTKLSNILALLILALGGAWLADFALGWLLDTEEGFFQDPVTIYSRILVPLYLLAYSIWGNYRFATNKGMNNDKD